MRLLEGQPQMCFCWLERYLTFWAPLENVGVSTHLDNVYKDCRALQRSALHCSEWLLTRRPATAYTLTAKKLFILAGSQKGRRGEIKDHPDVHLALSVHAGVRGVRLVSAAACPLHLWKQRHPWRFASQTAGCSELSWTPLNYWLVNFQERFTFGAQGSNGTAGGKNLNKWRT